MWKGFPGSSAGKEFTCNVGGLSPRHSPGWEDLLEEGMAMHSGILSWRIPIDRGAWRAIIYWAARSQTRLSG